MQIAQLAPWPGAGGMRAAMLIQRLWKHGIHLQVGQRWRASLPPLVLHPPPWCACTPAQSLRRDLTLPAVAQQLTLFIPRLLPKWEAATACHRTNLIRWWSAARRAAGAGMSVVSSQAAQNVAVRALGPQDDDCCSARQSRADQEAECMRGREGCTTSGR